MAFKKVEGDTWSPVNAGDAIEGVLVSKNPSELYKENFEYLLEVHSGKEVVTKKIFGTAILNNLMSAIELGKKLRIVFMGTKPSKVGQPTKLFEVFVDDEQ